MFRQGLMLMAVLGLAGVNAPSASADLCFRYGSGGGTMVARKAKLPAPDTCKTLAFFESGGKAGCGNRVGLHGSERRHRDHPLQLR